MIDQLIGDSYKIISFKYDAEIMGFQVECIPPGYDVACIAPFNKTFFPNHTPLPFLDEQVQVGEIVHVWLKEEEILKSEGWKEITKHTLANPKSPFKIGKGKKPYLGGAHKAVVCLDSKFRPLLAIDDYRFTPDVIKCVVKSELLLQGKNSTLDYPEGTYSYEASTTTIVGPGIKLGSTQVRSIIDLLRQAGLI